MQMHSNFEDCNYQVLTHLLPEGSEVPK